MKLFLLISFLSIIGFVTADKNSAVVEQEEGYFIFIKSKPVAEYEYLGTVKKGIALTGSADDMFNGIVRKCKKEFPKADAIIFTSMAMDKADCVKFK